MAISTAAELAADKKREEERKRREEARRRKEERDQRDADMRKISASPAVETEPSSITQARNEAQVKAQRGYDPRFDDPNYGKEKKDKPTESPALEWRRPADEDPYAATSRMLESPALEWQQPQSATQTYIGPRTQSKPLDMRSGLGQQTSPFGHGGLPSQEDYANRFNLPDPEPTPIRDFMTGREEGDRGQRPLLNPAVQDMYGSRWEDRRATEDIRWPTNEDGTFKTPWGAYQAAPRLDQLLPQVDTRTPEERRADIATRREERLAAEAAGTPLPPEEEDGRDWLTRSLAAPINAGPKIGAALQNAAAWGTTAQWSLLPGELEEVLWDVARTAFDTAGMGAELTETLPLVQGYTVGELASAAGDAIINPYPEVEPGAATDTGIPEVLDTGTLMTPAQYAAYQAQDKPSGSSSPTESQIQMFGDSYGGWSARFWTNLTNISKQKQDYFELDDNERKDRKSVV